MNEEKILAIEGIKKKLLGKTLNYPEAHAIMSEFVSRELGDIFVAYFTAASFREGFTDDELFYLVKAMVETGEKFSFKGVVADKHSIGGIPGTRTTLIVVPIIAAAGFLIPKTSSRAITTPAGTADCMELLAPVDLSKKKIIQAVEKTGGCIVWGGHLGVAPADDIIIRVEEPLSFESYDKIMISVLAKKVAMGSKLLILDVPVGPTMKIKYVKDAIMFADKFKQLAARFGIKVKTDINHQWQPAGGGVGALLEVKEVLRVLEQRPDRAMALEAKSLKLASRLLDMCLEKSGKPGDGLVMADEILRSGRALNKFREIIKVQGGDPDVGVETLKEAPYKKEIRSDVSGRVTLVNNYNLSSIAKVLGAPASKKAGVMLHKRFDEKVAKNDILMELFAERRTELDEAAATLKNLPVYEFKK